MGPDLITQEGSDVPVPEFLGVMSGFSNKTRKPDHSEFSRCHSPVQSQAPSIVVIDSVLLFEETRSVALDIWANSRNMTLKVIDQIPSARDNIGQTLDKATHPMHDSVLRKMVAPFLTDSLHELGSTRPEKPNIVPLLVLTQLGLEVTMSPTARRLD